MRAAVTALVSVQGLVLLPATPSRARARMSVDPGTLPDFRALTEAEWRERLTDKEYQVLRKEGTEPAWTSPLNDVKEPGVFTCAGCGSPLFRTTEKFESGSGWPSFWAPTADAALELRTDYKLLLPRTEVLCAACGGHLGHRFSDGPMPTGQRYCMNGVALRFSSEADDPESAERAAETFAQSTLARRPPLAAVLPELVLGSVLVLGELVGLLARGPASGTSWAAAALPWLPPGGLAGAVLGAFGTTVVTRNVGLLLASQEDTE